MEDQYVKVTFPSSRQVWLDERPTGFTNVPFQVETGHHVFHLGEPIDYTPTRQEVMVIGTLPAEPMVISFEEISNKPPEN